jgi:hypothetical protein
MDKGEEILYKSFELAPLPKLSVEIGEKATKRILNRLEYLGSLTIPRSLSFLGIDRWVTPMDPETALYVRDHPIYSSVRRIADHGIARQYGTVLLSGGRASESLIGAASAIALAQKNESGDIQIIRKKEIGLENKHAKELIGEFHNVDKEAWEKEQEELRKGNHSKENSLEEDHKQEDSLQIPEDMLKEESVPSLKEEKVPPLKDDEYVVPWLR